MRGDEARVVSAFCNWLKQDDWIVEQEVNFADVVATRGKERLVAEAKGWTAESMGLDIDTLYGQLLRRMSENDERPTRYGVVVPDKARKAVLRVGGNVRKALNISVYLVSDSGEVQELEYTL